MFCNTKIEEWAFSTQRKVKKRITNQTSKLPYTGFSIEKDLAIFILPKILDLNIFSVPNESTPLHSVADKTAQSNASGLTTGLPTVAITSASMEFVAEGKQSEQTLTVTGNDYRHMLQPQTSATPSNISEQTMATDTTVGSEVNLLSNKTSLSIDQVRLLD